MELINYKDKILHTPCSKFDFINPQCDIVSLVNEMITIMNDNNGIGLSANQIGIPLQVFVMRGVEAVVVINPRIVEASEETIILEEGCLSYPKALVKVDRPIWIRARYNSITGEASTHRFEGVSARVFQHEFDHIMYGRTMFDGLSKLKRDMAMKKMVKKKHVR